jgi:hypothetical protein
MARVGPQSHEKQQQRIDNVINVLILQFISFSRGNVKSIYSKSDSLQVKANKLFGELRHVT